MNDNENILGCFVSANIGDVMGPEFRSYIYGENKIEKTLKILKNKDYGQDLKLILFQFYINPIPYLLNNLKEIESYRKKEKSIGIPIVINEDNFFSKNESERYDFIRESLLHKIDLLAEVSKKNKLDINIELLKSDLKKILINYL
ncbi:hypothetical protein B0A79_13870 [Flavobacterium piscis]|uniref:Uncharacterized protein n=1 Tax=Flavobacterium piscis TaxID=1114874 RepID=A0ABX2XEZ6_9FLAO|nr:hypothetical protein [Flavobacterium piscis]OCB70732.1 hypothetical protein FLP_18890 [Flavobacterium piscis]OXG03479.1 hypothetical protein B0A79_13870 [Flavobacterium piscis]